MLNSNKINYTKNTHNNIICLYRNVEAFLSFRYNIGTTNIILSYICYYNFDIGYKYNQFGINLKIELIIYLRLRALLEALLFVSKTTKIVSKKKHFSIA